MLATITVAMMPNLLLNFPTPVIVSLVALYSGVSAVKSPCVSLRMLSPNATPIPATTSVSASGRMSLTLTRAFVLWLVFIFFVVPLFFVVWCCFFGLLYILVYICDICYSCFVVGRKTFVAFVTYFVIWFLFLHKA